MAGYVDSDPQETTAPSFLLAPLNSAARKVTEHVRNNYYKYPLDADNNTFGLYFDFSDPDHQVFTLGRIDTDIYIPESRGSKGSSQISDLQASFYVVQHTGAVLLQDHSDHRNTEPFAPSHSSSSSHGGVTVKFRSSRTVLVALGINSRVAFGRDKFYQFEIRWLSEALYGFNKEDPYIVGPRHSRTKKYVQGEKVGGGAYGDVWSVLDITNGERMAVKKFRNLSGKNLDFATREVANLFRINKDKSIHHDHILEIFDYAGGEDNWGEIFMPLMEGNLKTLVERTENPDEGAIADTVLRQMLLALQCIASHNIVHRDIKPENILWKFDESGNYHFCLGDFGLSHDPKLARTVAGTEPFMAPEVFHRQPQSTKVDIWSLFATFIWIHNTEEFRNRCPQYGAQQIHKWLVRLSEMPEYASIRRMASYNPKKRPSAEQQLAILDGDFEEVASEHGYDPITGDLEEQFQGMGLGEDQHDPGSSGSTMPDMPYYEPYTSGLYGPPWNEDDGQAGPSKRYTPAPMDGDVPGGYDQQAYVAMYDSPYARREDNDSGTQVPEMWTQRPIPPEEQQPGYAETSYQAEPSAYRADPSAYRPEPSYQDPNYREEATYAPETSYRDRDPRRKYKGKHKS
ncbi:kinase-like domain-containing protein [Cercophora newfieldiana]|uniref:Kinase-like domain-containing protein n=1 Tax=Cercophora newfieldiana TaxID=92897 RepID=A0AA39XZ11_9PEZI|nr:kinase-like domain-containing protein [Cercophora newfieldiana]